MDLASPPLLPTWLMSSVVPVARCQEVVDDEISNVTAQSLTGRKVEKEVHPSKDPAHRRFLGRSPEARERAIHTRQNLGSHLEVEMVLMEEGNQHLRPRRADG